MNNGFRISTPLNNRFFHSTTGSLPSEPSSYVERAINHLLQPIVEEVSQLPRCDWIVIQTANAMMKSWRDHILKEQIKFR